MSIRTEGALRWNVIALAFAGPALLAVIVWLLYNLKPSVWCGALIGAAKEAQIPAPQCSTVLLRLLDIHRDAIWILGSTLGLTILAIGLAATGMSLKLKGMGGAVDMGARQAAQQVADAAGDKADEIKESADPIDAAALAQKLKDENNAG